MPDDLAESRQESFARRQGDDLFPPDTVRSSAMRHTRMRADLYARHDSVVILLQGESGTGKSIMARYIHGRSPRAMGPFVDANLACIEESLAGSELFGHVQGAFTGASSRRIGLVQAANGGTLFLDELGKAPKAIQHRLLVLLDDRRIRPVGSDRDLPTSARVVTAANEPLEDLAAAGTLLADLLPRLGLFRIDMPSLRDRRDDIPGLILRMVVRHAASFGYAGDPPTVDEGLLVALQHARWPNNLRELDSVIQRLLADAGGAQQLTLAHCKYDLSYLRTGEDADPGVRALTPTLARDLVS